MDYFRFILNNENFYLKDNEIVLTFPDTIVTQFK